MEPDAALSCAVETALTWLRSQPGLAEAQFWPLEGIPASTPELASMAESAVASGVEARTGAWRAVPVQGELGPLGAWLLRGDESAPSSAALSFAAAHLTLAEQQARLGAEAARRGAELEMVRSVGEAMARAREPAVLIEEASLALCRAIDADVIRVFLRRGRGYVSTFVHGIPEPAASLAAKLSPSDPMISLAFTSGRPVAESTARMSEPTRSYCEELGLIELAVAPLRVRPSESEPYVELGVVGVARARPRPFDDSELRVLGAVADQLAVSLRNAELDAQNRRRVEDLSVITEVGRALFGVAGLTEALDGVATRFARLMSIRGCVVLMPDHDRRLLCVAGISEGFEDFVRQSLRVPFSQPGSAAAAAFDERVVRPGQSLPPELASYARQTLGWDLYWSAAVPLLVSPDKALGTLLLVNDRPRRPLTPEEQERTAALAQQIAFALDRSMLHTQLVESLTDLERTQRELVNRERLAALGELAAQVAHDVRNPLGVIFNCIGSLGRFEICDADARQLLGMIREEAERIDGIIEDLSDLARPTSLAPGLLALQELFENALASALASERARGMDDGRFDCSIDIEAGLGAITSDERLLHRVFVNLTVNALQAMPGGGAVRLAARRHEDGSLRMTVFDNGPGIPPAVRQRLFEPFFTTKAQGSGLGLAVVKRIVEAHAGRVEVTSGADGTTFEIVLPPLVFAGRKMAG